MNKYRWIFPFGVINIFLIENILKTYELPFANDRIRLICYGMLGILCALYVFFYLVQQKGIIHTNKVSFAMVTYYIVALAMLFLHSNVTSEILLLCSMIPFSFLISYFGFLNTDKTNQLIQAQAFIYIIIWTLFMYNKIFLHQAGAGKLNSVFYVVLLLPFILSIENKLFQKLLTGMLIVAAVISMKRTAVVIVVASILVYLWVKDSKNRGRVIKISLALIIMFLGIVIIQNRVGIDIIGKFEAMSEDGGSGRLGMYTVLLNSIFNRSIMQFIFGDGYYGVINIIGGTAHNDFLEVLFDFGVLGFCSYLFIYSCLIRTYLKMKKFDYKYSAQYLISIIVFTTMSMLSHVIMIPSYMMYISLYWGLILSDFEGWKNEEGLVQ